MVFNTTFNFIVDYNLVEHGFFCYNFVEVFSKPRSKKKFMDFYIQFVM
jgi:hypothetical protein